MNYTLLTYGLYLIIALGLTLWVARILFKNGQIFLDEVFTHPPGLASSINRLLLTGFYLINFGYAVYTMQLMNPVDHWVELMEVLSKKIGLLILILGAMHLFNLYMLFRMRKKARQAHYLNQQVQHD